MINPTRVCSLTVLASLIVAFLPAEIRCNAFAQDVTLQFGIKCQFGEDIHPSFKSPELRRFVAALLERHAKSKLSELYPYYEWVTSTEGRDESRGIADLLMTIKQDEEARNALKIVLQVEARSSEYPNPYFKKPKVTMFEVLLPGANIRQKAAEAARAAFNTSMGEDWSVDFREIAVARDVDVLESDELVEVHINSQRLNADDESTEFKLKFLSRTGSGIATLLPIWPPHRPDRQECTVPHFEFRRRKIEDFSQMESILSAQGVRKYVYLTNYAKSMNDMENTASSPFE